MPKKEFDVIVIGAGISGSTVARVLADGGLKVKIYEKEIVPGGMCRGERFSDIEVHRYGPHIFHTNDAEVYDFFNRFCENRPYFHRVLAYTGDKFVSMPISLQTVQEVFGTRIQDFLNFDLEDDETTDNLEDYCLKHLGRRLYEAVIKYYSEYMWGMPADKIPKSIIKRIPIRNSWDTRYFTDAFQVLPTNSYNDFFENCLATSGITTSFDQSVGLDELKFIKGDAERIIYTGPIGGLPYRYTHFEVATHRLMQPAACLNHTAKVYYTEFTPLRSTEYAFFQGAPSKSLIIDEFVGSDKKRQGQFPSYPIPLEENLQEAAARIAALPDNVHCLGRLARYKYINMDQAIREAIDLGKEILNGHR